MSIEKLALCVAQAAVVSGMCRLPLGRSLGVVGIIVVMSPTVFREGGFRFYFFSREELRMHIHVQGQNGEAKFWLEPRIELALSVGLSRREITDALRLIQEHEHVIRRAWYKHFPG